MNRFLLSTICMFGCLGTLSFARSECGTSSGGVISDGNYVNERIGLSYHIPAGLTPSDPASFPKDPKGRPTAILLALWKTPRDYEKPTVILMTDDPLQYKDVSAIGYMRRIANGVALHNGKVFQSGRRYQLSGITFYRVDYQFPDWSPPSFNLALTGHVGTCELSFELTAKTHDEIEKLFQSLITTKIGPKENR